MYRIDLIPGQALHARSLTLDHPSEKGEVLSYKSELPEGFKAIIERFKKVD